MPYSPSSPAFVPDAKALLANADVYKRYQNALVILQKVPPGVMVMFDLETSGTKATGFDPRQITPDRRRGRQAPCLRGRERLR